MRKCKKKREIILQLIAAARKEACVFCRGGRDLPHGEVGIHPIVSNEP